MQTSTDHRLRAFTLIEMITVLAVIGVLAALLLPALNGARERARQLACQSNLHQIGLAIFLYAGDNQNHTPAAFQVENGATIPWYNLLITNNYATAKVLQCPDDRFVRFGKTTRSYAMVIGYQNTAGNYNNNGAGNFWIAGSRLTCPYLTNSQVAVVAEYYNSDINPPILPTIEDSGTLLFVTSSYDYGGGGGFPPLSKHTGKASPKGNYLFLDGHVEFVSSLIGSTAAPSGDTRANQMFPPVPPTPQGVTGSFVPCP
jgi:prepilin-type N-terminal cleavage/methylation domain-containing protein/prepilin-type processing-associated H-X9-DG protein